MDELIEEIAEKLRKNTFKKWFVLDIKKPNEKLNYTGKIRNNKKKRKG